MADLLMVCLIMLMCSFLLGLTRVLRGPTTGDRMMATLLIGTTGIGLLLLLSLVLAQPALVDVALILALLAAIATAAFCGRKQGAAND